MKSISSNIICKKSVLFFVLLLSSCSFVSVIYSQLDWYLKSNANKAFNLNSKQSKLVDIAVDEFVIWHKKERLPIYIDFIDDFKIKLVGGMTVEDQNWLQDSVQSEFRLLIEKMIDVMIPVLEILQDKQIDHLSFYFKKINKKHVKSLKRPLEVYLITQQERVIEIFEDWLDYLTPSQRQELKDVLDDFSDLREKKLNYRLAKQKVWLHALRSRIVVTNNERSPSKEFSQELKELSYRKMNNEVSRKYLSEYDDRRDALTQVALVIFADASTEQKTHFYNKLDGYRSSLLNIYQ